MTVQYSIQKMVSDGTLSTIALGIQYLQRNDIYVRIAGVETPQSGAVSGYTWSFIDNTTLRILPVVPNGVDVVIYRRTDIDAMYNTYSQNAQFDEATVDENNQQLLYIAQEYIEQGIPGAGVDNLIYGNTANGINYYKFSLTDGRFTDVFGVPDGTDVLRTELAASTGSNLVGLPTGTLMDYLAAQRGIDPRLPPYNYKSTDNLAARTASLQAAFNDAKISRLGVVIYGQYHIDKITLDGHQDYAVYGSGVIFGDNPAGGSYVFGIKNCNGLVIHPGVAISCTTQYAYDIGCKVWGTDNGSGGLIPCNLHDLGFKITHVACAWQFGDNAYLDNAISEIVVRGGYTFGTKEIVRVIGSQVVVEFNGYTSFLNYNGADARIATVVGGTLRFTGGEILSPSYASGYTFDIRPVDSPLYPNAYGRVYVNGAVIEAANQLAIFYNPNSVWNVEVGSGGLTLSGCGGALRFDGGDLMAGSGDFTGAVTVDSTCRFHRDTAQPSGVYVSGFVGQASVSISKQAFNSNFKRGLQYFRPLDVTSQIAMYEFRKVFQATSLGNPTFPTGGTVNLVWGVVSNSGDNSFYFGKYNQTTGVFTVPSGGLNDVLVQIDLDVLLPRPNAASRIEALVNNVVVGRASLSVRNVSKVFDFGDLSAGSTIQFRLVNQDSPFTVTPSTQDKLIIYARTV